MKLEPKKEVKKTKKVRKPKRRKRRIKKGKAQSSRGALSDLQRAQATIDRVVGTARSAHGGLAQTLKGDQVADIRTVSPTPATVGMSQKGNTVEFDRKAAKAAVEYLRFAFGRSRV